METSAHQDLSPALRGTLHAQHRQDSHRRHCKGTGKCTQRTRSGRIHGQEGHPPSSGAARVSGFCDDGLLPSIMNSRLMKSLRGNTRRPAHTAGKRSTGRHVHPPHAHKTSDTRLASIPRIGIRSRLGLSSLEHAVETPMHLTLHVVRMRQYMQPRHIAVHFIAHNRAGILESLREDALHGCTTHRASAPLY
jgi:hypothetical protein